MKRSINICSRCGVAVPGGSSGMLTHVQSVHKDKGEFCLKCGSNNLDWQDWRYEHGVFVGVGLVCRDCGWRSRKESEGERCD